MMKAYAHQAGRLVLLPPDAPLDSAIWIDLWRPQPEQVAAVAALGVDVPTLADMEEIEISNRLYSEGDLSYMTTVLPGQTNEGEQISAPVCFVVGPMRLVTVRHHKPRPFETFPERADKTPTGCARPADVFLGLLGEIVGRLADILETSGKALDTVSASIFGLPEGRSKPAALGQVLARVGAEGDTLGRVRLACLTLERALGFYAQSGDGDAEKPKRGPAKSAQAIKSLTKDIQALEVHADYLSGRVGLASDATIGMINLSQNGTVRILSVVAALFLPPTLIASIYGMNFRHMPELEVWWAYPAALAVMLASSLLTYLILRWKNWL